MEQWNNNIHIFPFTRHRSPPKLLLSRTGMRNNCTKTTIWLPLIVLNIGPLNDKHKTYIYIYIYGIEFEWNYCHPGTFDALTHDHRRHRCLKQKYFGTDQILGVDCCCRVWLLEAAETKYTPPTKWPRNVIHIISAICPNHNNIYQVDDSDGDDRANTISITIAGYSYDY